MIIRAEPTAQPAHIRPPSSLRHHQIISHHDRCTARVLQQPGTVFDALLDRPWWWCVTGPHQLDGAEQFHHGMLS